MSDPVISCVAWEETTYWSLNALPGAARLLLDSVTNSLVDRVAALLLGAATDDVTHGEALLVLGDLQPGLAHLLGHVLAVEVGQSEAELLCEGRAVRPGHWGATHLLQPHLALLLRHCHTPGLALRDLNVPAHLHVGLPALGGVHLDTLLLSLGGTLRLGDGQTEVSAWLTLRVTLLLQHGPGNTHDGTDSPQPPHLQPEPVTELMAEL